MMNVRGMTPQTRATTVTLLEWRSLVSIILWLEQLGDKNIAKGFCFLSEGVPSPEEAEKRKQGGWQTTAGGEIRRI